ncbi:MAG: hypothetical protein ACRYF5_19395, partial [Janthinobacterium lividum]
MACASTQSTIIAVEPMRFPKSFLFRSETEVLPPGAAGSGVTSIPKSIASQQKINAHYEGEEAAGAKRTKPQATHALIRTRLQLEQAKEDLLNARSKKSGKPGSPRNAVAAPADAMTEALHDAPTDVNLAAKPANPRELKKKVKALQKEVERAYISGALGMTEQQVREKRKQQWKSASLEGFHTMIGSRSLAIATGIGAAESASWANKIAIHQGGGYLPQSIFSGWLRLVTQVPQILIGAGNPKLAPNLAASGDFRKANKALQAAMSALDTVQGELRNAVDAARIEPDAGTLAQLTDCATRNTAAIESLRKAAQGLKNQWILLEKECRGKKGSAAVSAAAGLMSVGASAIDPSGTAMFIAHKLLYLAGFFLQAPASAFDYMDGSVDFPQRKSALEIDLKLLVKAESRHKPLEELDDDDMDTTIATK